MPTCAVHLPLVVSLNERSKCGQKTLNTDTPQVLLQEIQQIASVHRPKVVCWARLIGCGN